MLIRANYKLWQVQKKFHDIFPFLRMEFMWTDPKKANDPIYLNKTLLETCKVDPDVLLVADDDEKPVWLKHKFRTIFNLNIRIYKKIGGIRWKEIPETEDQYLSEINRKCASMCEIMGSSA